MAAISHYYGRAAVKDKVAEFVHSSLTKSAYMQTYIGMIHPIPDQKWWPQVPACILIPRHTEHINPPPRIVQLGRPKKQRKRDQIRNLTLGGLICNGMMAVFVNDGTAYDMLLVNA
ncbi:hypothetical protein EZV62_000469 [Acer yangbiense]|uniref:Uncharacterized protein n=1 Tax=Acer yangbiense TaxID=1000413 RepID=A0A5C7IRE6_9ROSI|nr:hypothetical protein EZV62_000469 [Acer yangbiense]